MKKEIEYRIKELLIEILELEIKPNDIDSNQSLLYGSLGLDSVLVMELIFKLEDEFQIEIKDEELTTELFDSIASISEFVYNKNN